MKRRVFLSTTGTVGIVGAASGIPFASSLFASFNEHISLEEFTPNTKSILDHFVSELARNIQEHGFDLDNDYIASLAMPNRIIKKETKGGQDQIIYKNKLGNYVHLSMKNDLKVIKITDTL